MAKVRTRIAPSPTGKLHIGVARTALFNYLFTKKEGGDFLLRIEDTDRARSKEEFTQDILEGFAWLGISFSGETVKQSERGAVYASYIETLLAKNCAYTSEEQDDTGKNSSVIRFKNPKKVVKFIDTIRGEIAIDTSDLGDFVIAKDTTSPLYHLAVVVDDIEMGITHIIRGEDHISNIPRHILLYEAFEKKIPSYTHLPLILTAERTKLSKRHGAKSLTEYRDEGYLAPAIINFLALLGWHPKDDTEILSLPDLLEKFDIADIQKSGAIFDTNKLNFLNRHYLRNEKNIGHMIDKHLPEKIKKYGGEQLKLLHNLILDRINVLSDIPNLFKNGGEFDFLLERPRLEKSMLLEKKSKETVEETKTHVKALLTYYPETKIEEEYLPPEKVKQIVWPYAEEKGKGKVLWPMRVALTGKEKSPDPFTVFSLLGARESIVRLQNAHDILEE